MAALHLPTPTSSVVLDESALLVKGLSKFKRTVHVGIARQPKECYIGCFDDYCTGNGVVSDSYTALSAAGIAPMEQSEADLMFAGVLENWNMCVAAINGYLPDGTGVFVGIACGYRGGGVRVWSR